MKHFIFLFFLSASEAAERLESFIVEGNLKTKTSTIIRLTRLRIDQELTEEIIEQTRLRVLSSSLFETVELKKEEGRKKSRIILHLKVKEKLSWFIVPSLQYSQSTLSGGFMLGEMNLAGLNKKGLLFADWGPNVRRAVAAYRDPFLLNTKGLLEFDSLIRLDHMKEYQNRHKVREVELFEYGFTFLPGYQWSDNFKTLAGPHVRSIRHKLLSETSGLRKIDLRDGKDLSFLLKFEYRDTYSLEGLVGGPELTFESQLSDNRFLSDFNYFRQILRLGYGIILFDNTVNAISKASAQFGRTLPYYYELMLGGGNLRGYLDRQFRGDTKYTFQEELLFHVYEFNRFILRGLLFWDTGIIYFKDENFKRLDAWRNGLGGGFRVYLKGIAVPLIGYDLGWAVEENTFAFYLNIGSMF